MERLPPFSRRTFLKALAATPFTTEPMATLLQEVPRREVRLRTTVLYYHAVSTATLTTHAVSLIRRGVEPISLERFNNNLKGIADDIGGTSMFMVTLDDGYYSQYNEVLRAVDNIERQTGKFVPVTFFVMTKFDGEQITEDLEDDTPSFNDGTRGHVYMDKGQIVDLIRRGHDIQNHTADHIPLTDISGDRLRAQVEVAEEKIDRLWELAERERLVKAIAYPNGAYRGREAFIEETGLDLAFTTAPIIIQSSYRPFAIGRVTRP